VSTLNAPAGGSVLLPAAVLVRAPFAGALKEAGDRRDELVVLSADLSRYTDVMEFAEAHPERFFQMGMAEANMMGVAGGLAKAGFLPVPVTYGVFATRRAYDQVAMALCTGPSRGVIVAFLPGITTPFRATHQAIDDLALMRALPGMTVIDPMDATEMAAAFTAALDHDRTVYIRGLRGEVQRLLDPERYEFKLGAVTQLREGTDIGVISTGLGSSWALDAVAELSADGIQAGLLHVPTLKPVDADALAQWCEGRAAVVTVENHSTIGGLGSLVAETLAERGAGCRLVRLGVPDEWAAAGSLDYVRAQHGLDAPAIAARLRQEIER
jgi:transketolase